VQFNRRIPGDPSPKSAQDDRNKSEPSGTRVQVTYHEHSGLWTVLHGRSRSAEKDLLGACGGVGLSRRPRAAALVGVAGDDPDIHCELVGRLSKRLVLNYNPLIEQLQSGWPAAFREPEREFPGRDMDGELRELPTPSPNHSGSRPPCNGRERRWAG